MAMVLQDITVPMKAVSTLWREYMRVLLTAKMM